MTTAALVACFGLSAVLLAQPPNGVFQLTVPVQVAPAEAPSGASAPSNSSPASAALASELSVNLRAATLDSRMFSKGLEHGAIGPSAEGLNLSIRDGIAKHASTGITMPLRLRGDFEITVGYEELGIRNTAPGRGAGICIAVDAPGTTPRDTLRAVLHRVYSHQTKERHYVAERIARNSGAMQQAEHATPAGNSSSKKSRLRLIRAGSEIRFLVCEDDSGNFRELHRVEFSAADATGIELAVHNGAMNGGVRARLVELVVRSAKMQGTGPLVTTIENESIPGKPSAIEGETLVVEGPEARRIPLDEVLSIDLDRAGPPAAAQPANAADLNVLLYVASGDRVAGTLLEATAETVRIKATWGAEVEVPLLRLSGIEFVSATSQPQAPKEPQPAVKPNDAKPVTATTTTVVASPAAAVPAAAPADAPAASAAPVANASAVESTPSAESATDRWERSLAEPGETDTVLVRARDGALTSVAGSVQAMRDGKLELLYEGETRNIDLARLVGIVFAAHPAEKSENAPFQRFHLLDGQRIAGRWLAISAENYEVETPWQARWQIPVASVREITAHNGRMVHLSDLEPVAVEQVPYFGRPRPYQKDKGLSGGSLRVGSETFLKGYAVHSRTVLSFAIDGAFANFRATLGFDPAAGRRGRVACRVVGDGRELFADADLKADEPPAMLDLPVAGVSTLVLEIDFGEAEDAGDDVVWGNPRLYREAVLPPASTPAATTSGS